MHSMPGSAATLSVDAFVTIIDIQTELSGSGGAAIPNIGGAACGGAAT